MELNEWKPARHTGTLVIKRVWIIGEAATAAPAKKAAPKGEKGLVLQIVAYLCGPHAAPPVTSMAKVKDTYVAITPMPEPSRDIETGEEVRTKAGKITTKDRRRGTVGTYLSRLSGDEWLRLDGDVVTITSRDVPAEWFIKTPGSRDDLPHDAP